MTVKDRATLNSDADTNLASNGTGAITGADVRGLVKDLADSALLAEDAIDAATLGGNAPSDFATAAQGDKADSAVQPSDLADVATSGAYSDISGAPTLGTAAALDSGTSAGNVPVLDGGGLLDTSILPAIAITNVFTVATQSAMLALTAQTGDIAIRSDINKSFALSTNSPSTLADWKELLTPTDMVLAVAGLTGSISAAALKTALSLVKADVGLGNVDNTADSTKTVAAANGLKSATTTVVVSAATAPTVGQVLTATSTTAADWEDPTGGGMTGSATLDQTLTGSGSVLTSAALGATYKQILVIYSGFVGATSNRALRVAVSDDGTNFDTPVNVSGSTSTSNTAAGNITIFNTGAAGVDKLISGFGAENSGSNTAVESMTAYFGTQSVETGITTKLRFTDSNNGGVTGTIRIIGLN